MRRGGAGSEKRRRTVESKEKGQNVGIGENERTKENLEREE